MLLQLLLDAWQLLGVMLVSVVDPTEIREGKEVSYIPNLDDLNTFSVYWLLPWYRAVTDTVCRLTVAGGMIVHHSNLNNFCPHAQISYLPLL